MNAVPTLETSHDILGPWSLETSKLFWEGFAPSALTAQQEEGIRARFLCDTDWEAVDFTVAQEGETARISVTGAGDLGAATAQVLRFLSLDIDASEWPEVGRRDPVIADAQRQLPGLRPCGFYSPYEAAAWAVLSQRIQMTQAARLSTAITEEHGQDGVFPTPEVLQGLALDLPGRKLEYLHAVAEAALAGQLDGAYLRSLSPDAALEHVQQVRGLGPFAAELVVIRGANFTDVLPKSESRLTAEIASKYGPDRDIDEVTAVWSPFRSWAGVHLRALREFRLRDANRRN